jgi:hypothetical protein
MKATRLHAPMASSSRSQVSVRSGSGTLPLTCWASFPAVRRSVVTVAGVVTQLVTRRLGADRLLAKSIQVPTWRVRERP